jgi:N-acetylneuraminic acid mutarotase/glucose/arabinose dehydrogenase
MRDRTPYRRAVVLVGMIVLVGVGAVPASADTYSLMVSTAPDRSAAVALQGQTVSGNIYVFVTPTTGVTRVRFFVDDPTMSGAPFLTDTSAPYDLAGTNKNGTARAFNTGPLSNGSHSVTAAVDLTGGGTEAVTSTFTADNGTPPPATQTIVMSTSANRSSPVGLGGQTVSGNVYVFVTPTTGVAQVRFFLDDPTMAGTPLRIDSAAPFDLVGSAKGGNALPLDTSGLSDGSHNVSTQIVPSSGGTTTATADFTVSNGGPSLLFTPTSMSFALEEGGTGSQPLSLATSGGGPASFSVSDTASWLTVSPGSGSTPATLTAAVDATGLADGPHVATVTATAPGFTSALATVTLTVGPPEACFPLACEELLVSTPYALDFASDHGKIVDANGIGTGLTYVQPTTNGDRYVPSMLSTDTTAGRLAIQTTAGIASGGTNTNSQDNALGVGIDAASQTTTIRTTLVNPPAGTGHSEQAGLWFGTDEDNFVKLVVISTPQGTRVQHYLEVEGAQVIKFDSPALNLTNASVLLELTLSPEDRTSTAEYRVGDGGASTLRTFDLPPELFSFDAAGIDPRIGTRSFGGIFATHRLGPSPLTYEFDDFAVEGDSSGGPSQAGIAFDRSSFTVFSPTSMAFGPDGRLYVTEVLGTIHAFTLGPDHLPVADEVVSTLGSRLTLGIAVDPDSTPSDVVLWVSHSSPSFNNGEPDSGIVSRLSGPGFTVRQDVITGLPRAIANHATNSIEFGPDGRLYIAQGGNTGAGAPNDSGSEFGPMQEQPLSAAVLVADVDDPGFDGSCHNPDDIFGPAPCDVVPYATGLRNTYDIVFHTNGSLYGPDNGLGVEGTFPPSPTPPCLGFADPAPWTAGGDNPGQQPDILVRIEQGMYYGHPNPYRDECVFKDGTFQGVPPLPNYRSPMHVLGSSRSSDGIIEYLGDAFCGALRNELLITNYSLGDDITRVELSPDGTSVVSAGSLVGGFDDPLPIAQGDDGVIYVGEFGGGKVTALVPRNLGCWSAEPPLPVALLDAGGTALDGKLYVVGGKTLNQYQSAVHVFDPATGSWTLAADLPGVAVENPAVVALDGRLYAFGGSTQPFSGAVANAAVYDPALNAWTSLPPMPTARGGAAAQAIGGTIYVVGGMGSDGASLATVDVFDPATNTWSSASAMGTRRDNPGAAVLDGKLYVFGGRTRNADGSVVDPALISVEMYDPGTNTWTARAPMPTGRRTVVVGLIGGRAQVMGGEVQGGTGVAFANEEYDPLTDTWTVLTPMATPRHGAVAGTIGAVVYVVGGGPMGGSAFTDVNEAFSF